MDGDDKKDEFCEIMNDPKCISLVSINSDLDGDQKCTDIDCNVRSNDIDSNVKCNNIECNVKCDDIDCDVKCHDIVDDVWCHDDDDDVKCDDDDDNSGEVVEGDRKLVYSLPADFVFDDCDIMNDDDDVIHDITDDRKLVYSLPADVVKHDDNDDDDRELLYTLPDDPVIYFTEAQLVRVLMDGILDELCTQVTVVEMEVQVMPNVRQVDDVMYRLKVHGFVHINVRLDSVGSVRDSYTWSDDSYMRDIYRPVDRGSNYCTAIVGRLAKCIGLSLDSCISCDRINCSNYCGCENCINSPKCRL